MGSYPFQKVLKQRWREKLSSLSNIINIQRGWSRIIIVRIIGGKFDYA
jgi:hypothetical protein